MKFFKDVKEDFERNNYLDEYLESVFTLVLLFVVIPGISVMLLLGVVATYNSVFN